MRQLILWLILTSWVLARPKFGLLPLDDRPCNLLFVRQLARMVQVDVHTPPHHWLGTYLQPGQCERFEDWLLGSFSGNDQLIISSDMLCYGGLVASRSAATSLADARGRLEVLRRLPSTLNVQVLATLPRLALRTSEEQAPYEWALAQGRYAEVPERWVREYRQVRERNLEVLLELVQMARQGHIDQLVIGQDDSHASGPHIAEQERLRQQMQGLQGRVWLLSGADELSMDMLAGRLADLYQVHPELSLEYSEAGSESRIPPLESHPLSTMVEQHIELAGAKLRKKADRSAPRIFIQVPSDKPYQLPEPSQAPKSYALVERMQSWMKGGGQAALADLGFINRMDPYLAQALLEHLQLTDLEGFAAWNTPANAFGTVVAHVVVRQLGEHLAPDWTRPELEEAARAHYSFLLARLIDDYGYQTVVRAQLRQQEPAQANPEPLLSPYIGLGRELRLRLLSWAHDLYRRQFQGKQVVLPGGQGYAHLGPLSLEAVLPWPRLFEVELRVDVQLLRGPSSRY
jgi:hypothetical protein